MHYEKRYRSHHDAEIVLSGFMGRRRGSNPCKSSDIKKILNNAPEKDDRIIYIHVPYCDKICSFCSLNREKLGKQLERYKKSLIKDFKKFSEYKFVKEKTFKAVYFGGGTPTIFNNEQLEELLSTLNECFPLDEDCEITMESTLHNLTTSKLEIMEKYRVNRISIGIQTFSDKGRETLQRTGNKEYAIENLRRIRENFSGILGIDIIYNYPDQTTKSLLSDADCLLNAGVDGFSFYSLIIQGKSELGKALESGKMTFPRNLKEEKIMHDSFYNKAVSNGYELLELSKLVKPGKDEYRYIKMRYKLADVLPIGRGAGGRLGNISMYNTPMGTMGGFIDPGQDRYYICLGLMQYGNYDIDEFKKVLNRKEIKVIYNILIELEEQSLVIKNGMNSWKLTQNGIFWGNNIAVDLLTALTKVQLYG